ACCARISSGWSSCSRCIPCADGTPTTSSAMRAAGGWPTCERGMSRGGGDAAPDLMPVAVFDASTPPALAFMASLGRRGVPLMVCGPGGGFEAARWSRHCTQFRRCPPPEDHDRFQSWLRQRLRHGEIARVAPTSDLIAFHVAELREEFPRPVRRTLAPQAEL